MLIEDSLNKNSSNRPTSLPLHPALKGWVSVILNKAADKARNQFVQRLTELGIGIKHFQILFWVVQEGPLSQSELAQHLEIDRTLMVQLIDHMEKLELVERAPNLHDRRSYAITLTLKGEELLTQATEIARTVEAELLAPLSLEERQQLQSLLLRLVE